jgi:hypothetical protein
MFEQVQVLIKRFRMIKLMRRMQAIQYIGTNYKIQQNIHNQKRRVSVEKKYYTNQLF